MSRKKRSKKESSRIHFSRRCLDRFGFVPSKEERLAAITSIQNATARHVESQSLRVSIWDVMMRGMKVRVAYDKVRKELITALFPEDSLLAPDKLELCVECGIGEATCMGKLCYKCDHLMGDRERED